MTYPKLNFGEFDYNTNTYSITYEDSKHIWEVPKLVKYVEANGYKVFDMPIVGVYINHLPWGIESFKDVAYHVDRAMQSDLKYPILIDDTGYICDGWHRLLKAIIKGKSSVRAIRIDHMPQADKIEKKDKTLNLS